MTRAFSAPPPPLLARCCGGGDRRCRGRLRLARRAGLDRQVDVPFCVAQFATYHGAAEADADAWGLAKTAALVGVNLSDDAKFDIGTGKVAGGKAAVEACSGAYDAVGMAFAEAADELSARRYAPAKDKMASVAALTRRCDTGFVAVGARTPPALAKYGADFQKMAVIGIAITSLVK
jgi:hypothetical protein